MSKQICKNCALFSLTRTNLELPYICKANSGNPFPNKKCDKSEYFLEKPSFWQEFLVNIKPTLSMDRIIYYLILIIFLVVNLISGAIINFQMKTIKNELIQTQMEINGINKELKRFPEIRLRGVNFNDHRMSILRIKS